MKNIIVTVLFSAAIAVPSARAGTDSSLTQVSETYAEARLAAQSAREAMNGEAVVRAISRLTDIYNSADKNGMAVYPLRCLGERNYPIYHRDIAGLAILALRIQQGKYPGASGAKAISAELAFPVSELQRFALTGCMGFSTPLAKIAWTSTLEELARY